MLKKLKFALIIAALSLVAPWMVSFASGDDALDAEINVAAVDAEFLPHMHIYRGAIGRVGPGDLFAIDASDIPYDFTVNLYLTNAAEMIHCYRYLILEVAAYYLDGYGERQPARLPGSGDRTGPYLTFRNGSVPLYLTGNRDYIVAVAGGSYSSLPADVGGEMVVPEFYLAVE